MMIKDTIIEAYHSGNDRVYYHTGRISRSSLMAMVPKLTPAEWVWLGQNLYQIAATAILARRATRTR